LRMSKISSPRPLHKREERGFFLKVGSLQFLREAMPLLTF
jgi:hypothetical protein